MKRQENSQSLLPAGYRQLEYIESTGTQYIITNLTIGGHNHNVKWELDAQLTTSNGAILIGNAGTTSDRKTIYCYYALSSNAIECNCYNTASGIRTATVSSTLSRFQCSMDFNDGVCTYNQNNIFTLPIHPSIDTITQKTTIFCRLYAERDYSPVGLISAKLYGLTITIENEEHRMYPAIRLSDSKPGLYDIADNTFYTNAGTGEFLYA